MKFKKSYYQQFFRLFFLAFNRPGCVPSGLGVTEDGKFIGMLTPGQIGQGGDFNRFEFPSIDRTAFAQRPAFQGQQNGPSAHVPDSLAGIAGSVVERTNSSLAIVGSQHALTFGGSITGNGSLTNSGTLRLVGDANLSFTGPFINNGFLDIMTWKGSLPEGFVKNCILPLIP